MDPVLVLTLRICFAYLFALAAFHKLRNFPSFRYTLGLYDLVPENLLGILAAVVVSTEVYIALRMPFSTRIHFAAAAVLTAYALAIALNVVRGRTDLDCGCMGPAARTPLTWWLVARNMVLVGLLLMLSMPITARRFAWVDALSVLGSTAVALACWSAVERVLSRTKPQMAGARTRK